jgi:hypothetical protein
MGNTIYVLPYEEPIPLHYTGRQIADGIGVLAGLAVGLAAISTLLLGAWGW